MNSPSTDQNCDLNNPASIPASNAAPIQGGPAGAGEVKPEHHSLAQETDLFQQTVKMVAKLKEKKDHADVIAASRLEKVLCLTLSMKVIQAHLEEFGNAEDTNGELAAMRKIKAIVEKHV
jgi:hypothetical protein